MSNTNFHVHVVADGNHLSCGSSYKLHLPACVPAANFCSVTLYDGYNTSGLKNGQPFPSIGSLVQLAQLVQPSHFLMAVGNPIILKSSTIVHRSSVMEKIAVTSWPCLFAAAWKITSSLMKVKEHKCFSIIH